MLIFNYTTEFLKNKLAFLDILSTLKKIYAWEGNDMKSTGIVRKLDDLGRVCIPREIRRTLDIAENGALEIYVDGDRIMLVKYEPKFSCIVCGNVDEGKVFRGKNICNKCLAAISEVP